MALLGAAGKWKVESGRRKQVTSDDSEIKRDIPAPFSVCGHASLRPVVSNLCFAMHSRCTDLLPRHRPIATERTDHRLGTPETVRQQKYPPEELFSSSVYYNDGKSD